MTSLARYAPLVSRLLLSLIFVAEGLSKMSGWRGAEDYMASKGIVAIPILLMLSIAVELAGGISVLLGWRARYGALLLFLYLIPVTLLFHDFWAQTGMAAQIELLNFLKNIAIMGGLGLVIAFGAGPYSVDSVLRRRLK